MKKNVNNILFILLPILLTAFVLIFVCMPINTVEIPAEDGVLDLRGFDLTEKSFKLSGEWLVSFNNELPVVVSFPRDDSLFTELGYGVGDKQTCTLTILTDEDITMNFYLSEIEDSIELAVNGDVLYTTDRISGTVVSFMPSNGVSVIELTSVCHIAGKNGLRNYIPEISAAPFLSAQYAKRHIVSTLFLGGFIIIGLYHLLLYFFSPKEKIYPAFASTCVFAVGRILMEKDGLIAWFIPPSTDIQYRLYMLMLCLHGIFLCIFTSYAFTLHYRKAEKHIITVLFAIPTLAVVVLPVVISGKTIWLGYLPMILYIGKIIRSKRFKENFYLSLYFASLVLFMLGGITMTTIETPLGIYMLPLTYTTFMIVSQCILLSRNYMKALLSVEELNQSLEHQVDERTSQLAATNEKLLISQSALKEMISNISHDLKTPLTVLGQYLELLHDDSIDLADNERSDYIHVAYNKNLNMQRLIRNLFEATRIESGQTLYILEGQPLSELMVSLEERHTKYLRDLGLQFTVTTGAACRVTLDRDKIWNVFDNIIYNAARHTPKGGEIVVSAGYAKGSCVITISDTGEGIAAAHLPYIFDRFYKADKSRSGSTGDSGIGLYIAKTTMQNMNGMITAVSELGKGTCFTLTLPGEVM